MPRNLYNSKSDAEKAKIIKAVDEGKALGATLESVARQFKIGESTVRGWLRNRDVIMKRALSKKATKKFRNRKSAFVELEQRLFKEWTSVQNSVNTDGNFLQARAKAIASELNLPNFKASCHWLANFRERHNLTLAKACGTSRNVDESQVTAWFEENEQVIAEYEPENVFNADETGLFYRLLPTRTLCVRGSKCHGGEQSKERLSILLCVNMTGTEKLTPLVIGKAKKPRCFPKLRRHQKFHDPNEIGCEWRHQKNAWMDSSIFTEWLSKLQYKFESEKREVLLLLDNFSAHFVSDLSLPNIKLIYLPANTTSVSQPLDLGIIANVKALYKRDLLNLYWSRFNFESGNDKQKIEPINLLQAVRLFRNSWDLVKTQTIVRCFKKVFPNTHLEDSTENTDEVDFSPVAIRGLFPASVTLRDYL